MVKLLLVACTNVGRYMIEEIMNNDDISTELGGVVNINTEQGLNKANYDSYSDLAIKYKIDIKYCNNINDAEIVNWMKEKKPDIIIQSGWSQKFSQDILEIPRFCCIGEHPAPLPKGCGAACVNWAILTGETKWGDTFFEMVEEYDKGCVFAQKYFDIEKYDSVFTIYEKVAQSSCDIIKENLDAWARGIFDAKRQDDKLATHYKRRRPEDGQILSFNESSETIHNFVRAQTLPYPCAYFMLGDTKIKVLQTEPANEISNEPVGTMTKIYDNDGSVGIVCAKGEILKIMRVQIEGKPSSWAKDCQEILQMIGKSVLKK